MSIFKRLSYQSVTFPKRRLAKLMAGSYVQNMEEVVPVVGTFNRYVLY